jgi:hypothetical protein
MRRVDCGIDHAPPYSSFGAVSFIVHGADKRCRLSVMDLSCNVTSPAGFASVDGMATAAPTIAVMKQRNVWGQSFSAGKSRCLRPTVDGLKRHWALGIGRHADARPSASNYPEGHDGDGVVNRALSTIAAAHSLGVHSARNSCAAVFSLFTNAAARISRAAVSAELVTSLVRCAVTVGNR